MVPVETIPYLYSPQLSRIKEEERDAIMQKMPTSLVLNLAFRILRLAAFDITSDCYVSVCVLLARESRPRVKNCACAQCTAI